MKKSLKVILASATLAGSALVLVGCAPEPKPIVTPSATNDILTMKLPADVSAKGVILAAVLLSTADIEASLEAGLVTPAEVATAKQAIDDGTLDIWRQRAESDAK